MDASSSGQQTNMNSPKMNSAHKVSLTKIYKIIERLAEMFPRQDYQSRLEYYIASRRPQSAGDVEFYERQFNQQQAGGFL
jgi:hypothetical protein